MRFSEKKRRIVAAHLGVMWHFIKKLEAQDFDKCATSFTIACHTLGIPWHAITEASAYYAERMVDNETD